MKTCLPEGHPFRDFRKFLFFIWKHLQLPDPTPVQYDIAQYLQHGPRRLIIEAFRGVGKSWITVAFVCWLLLNDPELKIEVVSASKNLADNFTTFCLQLIESVEELKHLRPKPNQRCSKVQFDVGPSRASKDPSVKSVGITGQITGSRADYLISDDVEVPSNSGTQLQREKLSEAVKEYDAVLKPGGRIIYLGTPQTEMTLYNTLQERGYQMRVWPAEYPDNLEDYGYKIAPMIQNALTDDPSLVGKPTDPRRFSAEDLIERKASYGRTGYAMQFMLNPKLSDMERYPLKLNDLCIMSLDLDSGPQKVVWATSPELCLNDLPCVGLAGDRFYRPMEIQGPYIPYQLSMIFIDPAGRGKDETAYAVLKVINGQIFVAELKGLQGGYDLKTLETIANAAKKHKCNYLQYEANFGDGMFGELLKPVLGRIWPCTVEEVKHSKQKEARIIDTLEPVMNRHKLIIDKSVVENDFRSCQDLPPEQALRYQLFYQMTRITREKGALAQDDRLDCLAGGVAFCLNHIGIDTDKAVEEFKFQKMLEDFDEGIGIKLFDKNKPPKPEKTWVYNLD